MADITALVQSAIDAKQIAGAVTVVADTDGVLYEGAFGVADIATSTPMRQETMFWVASMSKPITAIAAMMLVDEGALELDAPVERYLPEFAGQQVVKDTTGDRVVLGAPHRPITVREALSHTSGLPFAARPELLGGTLTIDRLDLAHAATAYALTPLQTEPGESWSYSNAGINTVGHIIEVITGCSFADFVHARLLEPLAMIDTTFWPNDEQLGRLSKCYAPGNEDELREVPLPQLTPPYGCRRQRGSSPAGGYFATAADFCRVGRMLLRGGELDGKRYLSAHAVEEMTRKQTGELANAYGLGVHLGLSSDIGAIPGYGHHGAVGTELWINKEAGHIMVLMVHQDPCGPACDQLRFDFKRLGSSIT